MKRVVACLLVVGLSLAGVPATAAAAHPTFEPGAPGVGDPYYPLAGNAGYDVEQYLLDLTYDPETDQLVGEAIISAEATQDLSQFNLDFDGLDVVAVAVNGRRATWSRDEGELTVTPRRGLRDDHRFVTVVRYVGVPEPLDAGSLGLNGWLTTEDGAVAVGQPQGASSWFPVNGHPLDPASFTFRVTVPEGMEAVANGVLESRRTVDGATTWTWVAKEPMASYLATVAIDDFAVDRYREDGIRYVDAVDEDLLSGPAPRTGERYAISQAADAAYKRLTRRISVPTDGAELSFWVDRATEAEWDHLLVEAHTAGQDDWTTLPDAQGHTTQDPSLACPSILELHPFLTHYLSAADDGTCVPEGTTGAWWAASGGSDGYEHWVVDLSDYAGTDVEVSITSVSDASIQGRGVLVDDIEVSTGEGSTSFEEDDDPLDGWQVSGAPEGSPDNEKDWIVGTADDVGPLVGDIAQQALARQPEVVDFLDDIFGPYPFAAAGAIVTDSELGFALETQTRPVYSPGFFSDLESGVDVVVHELAHQWVGNDVVLADWRHIWLNEGFATYSEWLWAEHEGRVTAQEQYGQYGSIPAEHPFWEVTIGDPGPEQLFDGAVYLRGALTLHALRLEVGDDAFFRILRRWASSQSGDHVTTDDFVRLAERVSGQQLDDFFKAWLFTPEKPTGYGLPEGPPIEAPGASVEAGGANARGGEAHGFSVDRALRR